MSYFFNPLMILAVCALLSLVAWKWKRRTLSAFFTWSACIWFFVIWISPVPQLLMKGLEASHAVISPDNIPPDSSIHIVVLGGGHSNSPGLPFIDQLSDNALSRITEGIRLHRKIPGSKLVCSGYSKTDRTTQAEMLALAAIDLGVMPSDTLLMMRPGNTFAEAKTYSQRFVKRYPLILVTDAAHMKRAMKCFEMNGLFPLAAPTHHLIKPDPEVSDYHFRPSLNKIKMMEVVMHEYAGLLVLMMK